MKKIQQLGMAAVVTLVFTASAFAGDITTGLAPPSPPQASATTGEIPIPVAGDISVDSVLPDSVATVALNLLQTMLSVF
jgi:hypothetical protein